MYHACPSLLLLLTARVVGAGWLADGVDIWLTTVGKAAELVRTNPELQRWYKEGVEAHSKFTTMYEQHQREYHSELQRQLNEKYRQDMSANIYPLPRRFRPHGPASPWADVPAEGTVNARMDEHGTGGKDAQFSNRPTAWRFNNFVFEHQLSGAEKIEATFHGAIPPPPPPSQRTAAAGAGVLGADDGGDGASAARGAYGGAGGTIVQLVHTRQNKLHWMHITRNASAGAPWLRLRCAVRLREAGPEGKPLIGHPSDAQGFPCMSSVFSPLTMTVRAPYRRLSVPEACTPPPEASAWDLLGYGSEPELDGAAVLTDRGDCKFEERAKVVQAKGAKALVVVNVYDPRRLFVMGDLGEEGPKDPKYWQLWGDVPAVKVPIGFVTHEDGREIEVRVNAANQSAIAAGREFPGAELELSLWTEPLAAGSGISGSDDELRVFGVGALGFSLTGLARSGANASTDVQLVERSVVPLRSQALGGWLPATGQDWGALDMPSLYERREAAVPGAASPSATAALAEAVAALSQEQLATQRRVDREAATRRLALFYNSVNPSKSANDVAAIVKQYVAQNHLPKLWRDLEMQYATPVPQLSADEHAAVEAAVSERDAAAGTAAAAAAAETSVEVGADAVVNFSSGENGAACKFTQLPNIWIEHREGQDLPRTKEAQQTSTAPDCEALCCRTKHCISYTVFGNQCYLRTHGSNRAELQKHNPGSFSGLLVYRKP